MELQEEVYNEVVRLSEQGDEHAEKGQYATALKYYNNALELLPHPKDIWEAATWLYVAIGDAEFNRSQYSLAMNAYKSALECPDGVVNPYIWFSMGQLYFIQDNEEAAKECFMRAYMLDGEEIFEGQEPAYYELIKEEAEKEPTEEERKAIETKKPKSWLPPGWDEGIPPRNSN